MLNSMRISIETNTPAHTPTPPHKHTQRHPSLLSKVNVKYQANANPVDFCFVF